MKCQGFKSDQHFFVRSTFNRQGSPTCKLVEIEIVVHLQIEPAEGRGYGQTWERKSYPNEDGLQANMGQEHRVSSNFVGHE